ncbi:MAG: hypothetical protein LBT01_06220, partial [Spirochaetaceae bacterium]|nr:hypothetical protein [Spirochaetaceae bacterium]
LYECRWINALRARRLGGAAPRRGGSDAILRRVGGDFPLLIYYPPRGKHPHRTASAVCLGLKAPVVLVAPEASNKPA